MNRLISSAVGEKLASLLTVEYLRERGAQGNRPAYERILRRVRDVAPEERDAHVTGKPTARAARSRATRPSRPSRRSTKRR